MKHAATWLACYTYFDKTAIAVREGETFSIQLSGYMAMGEDYAKMGFVNPKEAVPQPIRKRELSTS